MNFSIVRKLGYIFRLSLQIQLSQKTIVRLRKEHKKVSLEKLKIAYPTTTKFFFVAKVLNTHALCTDAEPVEEIQRLGLIQRLPY